MVTTTTIIIVILIPLLLVFTSNYYYYCQGFVITTSTDTRTIDTISYQRHRHHHHHEIAIQKRTVYPFFQWQQQKEQHKLNQYHFIITSIKSVTKNDYTTTTTTTTTTTRRDVPSYLCDNYIVPILGGTCTSMLLTPIVAPTAAAATTSSTTPISTTTTESPSIVASTTIDYYRKEQLQKEQHLYEVTDPNTYSAIVYAKPSLVQQNVAEQQPSSTKESMTMNKKKPLLIVLHGAGKNQYDDVWSLTNIRGEHSGLLPSLIANNIAPIEATDNFIIVTPYCGMNQQSFYNEPRSKLIQFINFICSTNACKQYNCLQNIDRTFGIYLFGFSDGATVAIELATTKIFKACIICAYGYSGTSLPNFALQRLQNIPMWIFHCKEDVIFPVHYSDNLVKSLRSVCTVSDTNTTTDATTTIKNNCSDIIRYTRYDTDQEGFTGTVKGHSVGITASKLKDIYIWMLSIP